MEQHPIESLMSTAMESLRDMIDVNTIIGDMVESKNGTVIIPVSKVSFGFAAGGSEFSSNKSNRSNEDMKLPFGGGSGAGVNISPTAFLVITGDVVRLLTLDSNSPIDRIIDLAPDVINKISSFMDKNMERPLMEKTSSVIKIEKEDGIK